MERPGTTVMVTLQLAVIWHRADELDKAGDVVSNYLAMRKESNWNPTMAAYMVQEQLAGELDLWFEDHLNVGKELIDLIISDSDKLPNLSPKRKAEALRDGSAWLSKHNFYEDAEALLEELRSLLRDAIPGDPEELSAALARTAGPRPRLRPRLVAPSRQRNHRPGWPGSRCRSHGGPAPAARQHLDHGRGCPRGGASEAPPRVWPPLRRRPL